MRFDGKVVLVTGASRGIGKGIAELFGELGAKVALNYFRGAEEATALVEEMHSQGIEAEAFQADLRTTTPAASMVDRWWPAFGTLDVLVNNAGINLHRPASSRWSRRPGTGC